MFVPREPRFPDWLLSPRVGAVAAIGVLGALTAVLAPFASEGDITVVAMVFILAVLLAAAVWGYSVGLLSAAVADVLLNVFFVAPLYRLTVHEPRHVATLVVFLAVATVGATMLALLRRQLAIADERRAELAIMLDLSRELAAAPTPRRALEVLADAVRSAVNARGCEILQPGERGWQVVASTGNSQEVSREDAGIAQACSDSGEVVRKLADAGRARTRRRQHGQWPVTSSFVPFRQPGGEPGVIHVIGPDTAVAARENDALLRAFADEAGVAVHRATLAKKARDAEAIRRSDEFKSALLSSVSHDLRSPLTAIKAAVGSLRTNSVTWTDSDRAQMLEIIESQTDRLTETVTDLLDMSRLEAGAVEAAIEPIEVRPLLQDAVTGTRVVTAGRDVLVDAQADIWARGDHGLLLHALTNLVENAARYSHAGGAISVRGNASGGRVLLEVSDQGPGIDPADLPHIFDRFYRGATGKRTPGTGLGLAIVRAMVERCGGTVTVDSTQAGTTFRIALQPARRPH